MKITISVAVWARREGGSNIEPGSYELGWMTAQGGVQGDLGFDEEDMKNNHIEGRYSGGVGMLG